MATSLFTRFILITAFTIGTTSLLAQETKKIDSLSSDGKTTYTSDVDTTKNGKKKVREYKPGKAALRSAILPGLGQIYNKKYWKLPIVYGALGISAGVFVFNYKSYKDTKFAYAAKYKASQPGATPADSVDYFKIKPPLERYSLETLRYYRNEYRRDIDYSILFFVVLWGLNVVDAAVDAHLKAFDVSPDLSLKLNPGKSEMAGTNGLSLVLTIGKNVNPRPLKKTFID